MVPVLWNGKLLSVTQNHFFRNCISFMFSKFNRALHILHSTNASCYQIFMQCSLPGHRSRHWGLLVWLVEVGTLLCKVTGLLYQKQNVRLQDLYQWVSLSLIAFSWNHHFTICRPLITVDFSNVQMCHSYSFCPTSVLSVLTVLMCTQHKFIDLLKILFSRRRSFKVAQTTFGLYSMHRFTLICWLTFNPLWA